MKSRETRRTLFTRPLPLKSVRPQSVYDIEGRRVNISGPRPAGTLYYCTLKGTENWLKNNIDIPLNIQPTINRTTNSRELDYLPLKFHLFFTLDYIKNWIKRMAKFSFSSLFTNVLDFHDTKEICNFEKGGGERGRGRQLLICTENRSTWLFDAGPSSRHFHSPPGFLR